MWQRLWAGLWKIKYRSGFYLDKACVLGECHYAAVEKRKPVSNMHIQLGSFTVRHGMC